MSDIKEDIKILKERYKRVIDCINSRELPLFVEDTVEDIFNRLEQLEKENEELKCKHTKDGRVLFTIEAINERYILKSVLKDHLCTECQRNIEYLLGGSDEKVL